jgi:hypothetical protein
MLIGFIVGYTLLVVTVCLAILLFRSAPESSAPVYDYERMSLCIWERGTAFTLKEQMSVLRYCVELDQ